MSFPARLRHWSMRVDVPVLESLGVPALILAAAAVLVVFRFKVGMIPTIAACAGVGVIHHLC